MRPFDNAARASDKTFLVFFLEHPSAYSQGFFFRRSVYYYILFMCMSQVLQGPLPGDRDLWDFSDEYVYTTVFAQLVELLGANDVTALGARR